MASDTQPASLLARPSTRPQARSSRHALEPNPFEQSFSSKPGSSASPEADAKNGERSSRPGLGVDVQKPKGVRVCQQLQRQHQSTQESEAQPVRGATASNEKSASTEGDAQTSESNKDADAATSKRLLPPVAAIASLSTENTGNHYPWSGGGIGSLRAGPLSPAMLTGPQAFDPASFRTGFTPDLSNFKTGLTPLGNAGSGYPLPSPGTSAFMAMVNTGGPPITPNTFQALASNLGGSDGQVGGSNTQQRPSHGGQTNGDFDLEFGKQFSRQSGPTATGPTCTSEAAKADKANHANTQQSVNPDLIEQQLAASRDPRPPKQKCTDPPQSTQAVSGLFLLSQAHQELSKRDQAASPHAQNAASHLPGVVPPPNGMVSAHTNYPASGLGPSRIQGLAPSAAASRNNKRKKSNAANSEKTGSTDSIVNAKSGPNPSAKSPPLTAAKASKKMKFPKKEDSGAAIDDQNSGSDDDSNAGGGEGEGSVSGGGGDDDEEKRKNFLERNRQAALKCRQRKKAWLQDLQAKVAFFESENGNLQNTIGALRNEVMYLKSQLMQAQQQMATKGMGVPSGLPGMPAPDGCMLPPGMHLPPGVIPNHGQHGMPPPHQNVNQLSGHHGPTGPGAPHQQPHGFSPHGLASGTQANRGFSPVAGPKAQAA